MKKKIIATTATLSLIATTVVSGYLLYKKRSKPYYV